MIRLTEIWSYDTIQEYLDNGYNITKCPVCGNEAFDNWAICPHCGWEHDELIHKGYSCANRSYIWWYKLKYKIKQKLRLNKICKPDPDLLDPATYIGSLLGETKDGQLSLTYYNNDRSKDITMTYPMDWDFDDACFVATKLDNLLSQLHSIFHLRHSLKDREHNAKILTPEQMKVWETYLAPFEGQNIEEEEIARLQNKEHFEGLTDEETELLESSRDWYETQCLQRLPYNRCAPTGLIHEARRYYKALSGSCEDSLVSVSYYLAEQMVLYYCKAEHVHTCRCCGRSYVPEEWIVDSSVCPFCNWQEDGTAETEYSYFNGSSLKDYRENYFTKKKEVSSDEGNAQ